MDLNAKYSDLKKVIGAVCLTNEKLFVRDEKVIHDLATETHTPYFVDCIKLLYQVWETTLNPNIAQLVYSTLNLRSLHADLELPEELNEYWNILALDYWRSCLKTSIDETVPLFGLLGLPRSRISLDDLSDTLMKYISMNRKEVFVDEKTGAYYVNYKGEKLEIAKAFHEAMAICNDRYYQSTLHRITDRVIAYHGQFIGHVMEQIRDYRKVLLVKKTDLFIEEVLSNAGIK